MKIIGFKISYADGSVESADVADWDSLPVTDVVAVMAYFKHYDAEKSKRYRKALDGCDWYWFDAKANNGDGDILGVRSSGRAGEWTDPPKRIFAPTLKQSAPELPFADFKKIADASVDDEVYP